MVGKYRVYSEYKDSDEAWFEQVPKHWDISSLRWYIEIASGENLSNTNFNKTKDNVNRFRVIGGNGTLGYSKNLNTTNKVFAIGRVGALCGNVHFINEDCWVTDNALKLSSWRGFYDGYFNYLLKAARLNEYASTTAQPLITGEQVKSLKVPIPLSKEQEIIASFLDHETAKIDSLIEKQQQLIKLLKEKRQAVISHAVTKGLNPNVAMRDSGVEWLGEVPEHWDIKRLRYLGNCQNGINIGAEYFGSGYPFVSYSDVYKNEVLPKKGSGLVESTKQDRKIYSVLVGDVMFTRTSETVEEIGLSSTCLATIEEASFAGFLIRFRPLANVLEVNFSKYYFRNVLMRTFFIKEMNLVTRASLSQDLLKKLPVTLPPLKEQVMIAKFLDRKSEVFKNLTGNAKLAIKLLQERRTALISAAVTGKIDVRNWYA